MSDSLPFRIVVCVRPPDLQSLAGALGTLDSRAVDYAVKLARRSEPGASVTAVAVGDDACVSVLRECIARGVDEIFHVAVEEGQSDGVATAQRLAGAVSTWQPDLVLCGNRSDIGMHGTVPRHLAHALGMPFLGSIVDLQIDLDGGSRTARAVQRLERGARWAWGCTLPVVCAVDRDITAPRYLAVRRLRRSQAATPVERDVTAQDGRTVDGDSGVGHLVIDSRIAPRIRPKKSSAPSAAAMTPADRMKMLRAGGKAPLAGGGDDDKPRRIASDPESAANEILALLEKKGFLKS